MKVKDVMQVRVITVLPEASYEEAARLLSVYNISGVPVVNEGGEIIGILSEKDLFRVLYPNYDTFYKNPESYTDLEIREQEIAEWRGRKIKDVMSTHIKSVHPDDPVLKAGSIMLSEQVHRLPVVAEGKLVGIVSRRDIFKHILNTHLQDDTI